jgi:hypothetical protein
MPRIVNAKVNEVRIWDNISGSEIVLHYRQPTTKERQEYTNMSLQRHGNKITSNKAAARLKYGSDVLVGFREGDFVKKEGEKLVAFSSDPNSENYLEEWKKEIEEGSCDIVMLLAAHVFDAPAEISGDDIEGK